MGVSVPWINLQDVETLSKIDSDADKVSFSIAMLKEKKKLQFLFLGCFVQQFPNS